MPRQGRGGPWGGMTNTRGGSKGFSVIQENENMVKSLQLNPLKLGRSDKLSLLSIIYLVLVHALCACVTLSLSVMLIGLLPPKVGGFVFHFVYPNPGLCLIATLFCLIIVYIYHSVFQIAFLSALYIFMHSIVHAIPVMFMAWMLELFLLGSPISGLLRGLVATLIISWCSGYLVNANLHENDGHAPETPKEKFVQQITVAIGQFLAAIFLTNVVYTPAV